MSVAPKPTAIKRLEGNPGKRPLNEHEPQPAVGCPMPEWLPPGAQAYWKKYAPELEAIGVLTRVDESQFAAFCCACWDFEYAVRQMKPKKGKPNPKMQDTRTGYEQISGWETVRRRAADEIRKFGAEFGMSASSRTRIQAQPKVERDLEQLLGDDTN